MMMMMMVMAMVMVMVMMMVMVMVMVMHAWKYREVEEMKSWQPRLEEGLGEGTDNMKGNMKDKSDLLLCTVASAFFFLHSQCNSACCNIALYIGNLLVFS